jgi:hypothetical protein
MNTEILSGNWKQHPVFKDYFFCDDGRVASNKKGKFREIIGTKCGQQGYRAIPVLGSKKIYVHRTICELFNGHPSFGQQCRHLDGNLNNNSAANLKWGTPSENAKDKILHGTSGAGEKNSMAKLSSDDVKKMREIRESTNTPFYKIAKQFNVSTMTAFRAVTQRSFK